MNPLVIFSLVPPSPAFKSSAVLLRVLGRAEQRRAPLLPRAFPASCLSPIEQGITDSQMVVGTDVITTSASQRPK
jgi:hypothetical protein